jgi:hypothetical protein
MKLPIEEWLELQDFNESIKSLFSESITCYKASAYRAAFLFSYLGFQSVIKDRVLKAEKPENIHERAWEQIKNNLRKEDSWDTEVNECIKKSDENKRVFILTEDLRQQAIYWKFRRNDCAHSKPNIINFSHVESFWAFLYSNLPKFVVNGGKDSLLQKIERHFDPNFTKQDASFLHLIQEVPNAIYEDQLEDFLEKLNEIFDKYEPWYPIIAERSIAFWNELIKIGGSISNAVITLIKKDIDLESAFLNRYSDNVLKFYGDSPSEVRNLWRAKFKAMNHVKFKVLSSLLRNNLLEDKEEVFNHVIKNLGQTSPQDLEVPILMQHGYFLVYKKLVFCNESPLINRFEWGNSSKDSVGSHLDIIGLDDDIVKNINNTFSYSPYPFKLQDSLTKYFKESPTKKEEYLQICERLHLIPTENLGF